MTEKDMFIQTWDKEFQTTLRVFKAYPPEKLDLRPAEKLRTARELAWVICADEMFVMGAIAGKIDFSQKQPPAPATMKEIISSFENIHKQNMKQIQTMTPEQFKRTLKFPVGPKKMGDVPAMDLCWLTVFDSVHHRGQFSVYLRIAGGKLPSIYGPTADEPWM